ncbi:MAG: hypothetical protein ACR650_09830 [Methylocystis sp.]
MTEELDLAPVSRPEPQGAWEAPPPEGAAWRVADFSNAMDAADKAFQFDQDIYAKRNALSDAVDRRNKDIERATGVTLENPYDGGYEAEARDRLFKSGRPGNIRDVKEQIWAEKLGALQTQYPDHADTIGADRPIMDDAKQLADYWSDRAARGEPGLGAPAGLAASFLGGLRGFMRNPLNVATLLVGGGEVGAATVAGRIAQGFIREAAVNAGQQALSEPAVQSWRAERVRESGLLPALEDIGMAGFFGGTLGAGAQGAKALWRGWKGPAASPEVASRAAGGDAAALRELAATPVAEHAPGLRASVEAMDADAAAFAAPPKGMEAETTLSQALDHGEGLSDALPEFMLPETVRFYHGGANPTSGGGRWVSQHLDYARAYARHNSDNEHEVYFVDIPKGHPLEVAARAWEPLDEYPGSFIVGQYKHFEVPEEWARKFQRVSSAPENPPLSNLGPAALDEAQSGRVSPEVAMATAARVADEGEQLAVMRAAMAERPRNLDEAAEAVSREMESRHVVRAMTHLAGNDADMAAVPHAGFDRETVAHLQKQVDALEGAAARAGEETGDRPREEILSLLVKDCAL